MHSLGKMLIGSGTCAVCNKSLGGFSLGKNMKCSKCGITVHGGCKDKLPSNCTKAGKTSPSSTPSPAGSGKKASMPVAADDDIFASMGITDDMLNGDLDNLDDNDLDAMDSMDDNALMAEINKPAKKGKKSSSAAAAPPSTGGGAAAAGGNSDDLLKDAAKLANTEANFDNVELTDDDMNDPELLKELDMLNEPSLDELKAEAEAEIQKFQACKASHDMDGARKHSERFNELKKKIKKIEAELGIDEPSTTAPAPTPAPQPVVAAAAVAPKPKTQPTQQQQQQQAQRKAQQQQQQRKKLAPAMPTQSFMGRVDNEEEEFRISVYEELESYFKRKEYDIKTQAVEAKRAGDRDKALELFREAKKVGETVAALGVAKTHPSRPMPPEFTRKKNKTETVVTNDDIDPKQLELTVVKLTGLNVPGYTTLSTYVYTDCSIDDRQPHIHFQSEVIPNNANPEFNFTTLIDIERTRNIGSLYERKKIPVTIYHKRALKDAPIGKFDIPLNALVNKAQALLTCQILAGDMKHKMPKATATVKLRLNKPAVGEDVKVTETEEIVITGPIFVPSDAPAQTQTPPPPTAAATPTAAAATVAPQPQKKTAPAATAATTAATTSKYNFKPGHAFTDEEKESLVDDTYDIKKYNSMELSEWETERVNKEIAACKKAKKPVPDELVDRPGLLENQSNMLVVRVQTGKLTIEMYVAHLERLIAADKELLGVLTMAGLTKEEGVVKERIKILQNEIASANEGNDEE